MSEDDRAPTPEESWAIIDAQRREIRHRLNVDDRILYGAWGIAWGAGYLAMFADSDRQGRPGDMGSVIFGGLIVAAIIVTIVHSTIRGKGVGGAFGTLNARLGAAWPVAFGAVFVITGAMFGQGLEGPGVGIITNALPCLVVACLFMTSGAAWDDRRQFRLGIWIAATVCVASVVGPPHLYLVMAALGGGGFLVAALLDHLDRRRR
ncbi:hypothetical protein [uncultured Aeromicrobium sp.]|uniref:hypothetical protein n=1 Tax=uncultured Aeromicrobium sp. TaxID=337820 RepID=UPI0025E4FC97|nr:hypothetical protein [uncultured Aeromicrobium sp.]